MANYGAQALKRSQLYEETQQARLTAESAVQTRDEFLAIASHELKNPLTGLIGHVQLLERRLLRMQMLTDRDGQSLKTINTQAKRIQSMIEQLLDLAHLDKHVEFDSELINLPILINTVIAEVEPSLQRHTISFNEKVSEVILRGDPIRLAQVLHNLLGNAIKYSPEGGNVSVELDRQGDHVKISITDQGIGIAAESIPKLFSRFYRVPNSNVVSVNGFGIGLYVVKEIVQRHGGEVLVESQLGVGSTFTITLPISGMM
jgi:signal transduction histidine kinase